MAYELSSSVANGNVSAVFVAARDGTITRGGAISPDGTTIAVHSSQHGGAVSADYGIDIWQSGSSGWTEVDSIDTLSRYHDQIVWLNNNEFVSTYTNNFYSFRSGSSGWAEDYSVSIGNYNFAAIWPSPDKSKLALTTTPYDPYLDSIYGNNTFDPKISFMISGSGGYTSEQGTSYAAAFSNTGPINSVTWVDNDNVVLGMPGQSSGYGRIYHWTNDGDGTWSQVGYLAGQNVEGRRSLGIFLHYHTGSETLMVGATGPTSANFDAYRAYINLFPSSSSGLFPSTWTDVDSSWAGYEKLDLDSYGLYTDQSNTSNNPYWLDGITLNVDASDGDRFVVASGIYGSSMVNRAFITAETGSSGWLFNQLNPEGNGRGKTSAYSYGWGPSQLSDGATRYVTWMTGNLATSTYGFTVYDTGLSSGGGGGGDVTAPTISSVELSSDNSTATVTFSEDVYNTNGGSGDLEASDFSLSLSGGNSSLISLNATPSGISKTSQSVWVLTLNGTDLDFLPDGTETLVVDSASDTSIYDAAGNAHTAAHGGQTLSDRERYIKIRILNKSGATRYYYAGTKNGAGTGGSNYIYLGNVANNAALTSSVYNIDLFTTSSDPQGIYLSTATGEIDLENGYPAGGINGPIRYDNQFISYFDFNDGAADAYSASGLRDSRKLSAYSFKTGSSQNHVKYVNITQPSDFTDAPTYIGWGDPWTQFDASDTQLDTVGPKMLSAELSSNTNLKIVFDGKPVDSDGNNLTNAKLQPYSSAALFVQRQSNGTSTNYLLKRTVTGSLFYSTTTVTDDTLNIPIDYEGFVESGDKLYFRLTSTTIRDEHNNGAYGYVSGPESAFISGTVAYPSTGRTGTITYDDVNFHLVNSHESATAYFYMRVDNAEKGTVGGNPVSYGYLDLGSVAAGQTGSFTVSDVYFDDAKRGGTSPQHKIYAHTASVTFDFFSSPDSGTDYLDSLTLNQYSSSTEPYLVDNRRNFSASFDGSEFTTQLQVFVGDSTSELDYYTNTGIASLDSQTSGTGSVTIDWGERIRAKTTGGTPSSVSDLSGGLPNNLFKITQDTGSTLSNLRVTSGSLSFATSTRTGVASGSWTFTFNYDGLADGTEKLKLVDRFEFSNGFYDDELNTALGANGEYWSELGITYPNTWQNSGTQSGFALAQDALATEVSETITVASGGTVKAGGTNDSPAASVVIAAGAFDSDTEVSVTTTGDRNPRSNGIGAEGRVDVTAYSPLIEVTPHEQELNSAATLTFKLDGSVEGTCPSDLVIMKRNHSSDVWYPLPSSLWSCSDGQITITTTRFSQYQAIGGTDMARTKMNNTQLQTLTEANLVSGSAITFTGSAAGAISDSSVFLIQNTGDVPKSITAASMATYFAGEITVSASEGQSENFRLTFIDPTANTAGLAVDGDADTLVWNPSTDTLTVGGAVAGVTNLTVTGDVDLGDATSDTITVTGRFDSDLVPSTDGARDLGASGLEWKDLYIDGVAYVDSLQADQLGAALDANDQAITNINVDSGAIDGTVIGANSAAAGTFTTLVAGGDVDLGDATSDTITATGRFDSDLVPSTDSARALGTSTLQWSAVHVDVGHIDQLGSALDANDQAITNINVDSGAIDGAVIGANSAAAGTFTSLVAGGDVDLGDATSDTITATGRFDSDLVPSTDSARALGTSTLQWSAVHVDVGHIDQLGSALDANSQAITNINVDSGAIDGAVIGANSAAAGTFTDLVAGGNVDLGDATTDTITVTGQFDSDLIPIADSTSDLGTSAKQWAEAHIDHGYIDDITATGTSTLTTVDINGGAIDGTVIGANSAAAGTFTTLSGSGLAQIHQIDADRIVVETLDVNTINSNTITQNSLEIEDYNVLAGLSGSSSDLDGGGFQIGGSQGDTLGSMVWNDSEQGLRLVSGSTAIAKVNSTGVQVTGILSGSGILQVPGVTVGTAVLDEADLEQLDDITAGTVAASKAVVVDSNKDIDGFRSITASSDVYAARYFGDGAGLTNVGATIAAAGDAEEVLQLVFASGTTSVGTSATLFVDSGSFSGDGLRYNIGSNVLLSPAFSGSGTSQFYIGQLDQLVAQTADINGGSVDGAVIGANSAAAGTFTALTAEGNVILGDAATDTLTVNADLASDLIPSADDTYDLGDASNRYAEAHVVVAHIDQLGQALDANSQAITNINVDSGAIDGAVIGANSAAAGTFTSLVAGGDVDLGDATSDTITATGRFDSDLVPSTDAARDLGTSALGWNDLHLGSGGVINLDGGDVTLTHAAGKLTLGGDGPVEFDFNNHEMTNVDIDSGAIDGAVIGASSAAAGTFTTLTAEGNVILGDAATDTVTINADLASDLIPSADNTHDLGDGSNRYAEAHIVAAHIDQLGQALDANSVAITNINVDSGAIDGAVIGANSAAAGSFTTVSVASDGALTLNGTAVNATAAELNAIADVSAAATYAGTVDVSADHFIFRDGAATGANKIESIADFISASAGDGLIASSGVFSIESVEQVLFSGSANMSLNAVTASLSATPVDNSIQVFLNGILQTNSGSLPASNPGVFDYKIETDGTTKHVILEAALDSDDILTLSYIKKYSNS